MWLGVLVFFHKSQPSIFLASEMKTKDFDISKDFFLTPMSVFHLLSDYVLLWVSSYSTEINVGEIFQES